ncbi:MAG: hypothetical protein IPO09_11345 [Anaeromyxobacter sp.]|nr:hypothetical protein [Anaeromyxobacter sp.]MBL0276850.1 hypothetical protein [Anaeromyxobacter sp.]
MRRRTWLALAALLLAAAAGLLALVEEPPERPLAPVAFPRRLREAERRRVTERRTLPPAAAPATAAPGAEPSPPAPRRDPFLTALPAAPGEPVVIFEANALRHSRLGELFIRCALAKDPDFFAGLSRETGLDVLKDVDRVGFAGDAVVISGTFDAAHWERLEQQAEATPYGDEGRLYRDRGKAGAPVLARWRDQVVVFSPDEAAARLAVDQLEGRAEAPPPLDGDLAYGEVYGVIPGAAVQRLFSSRDAELGARLAAAASRVELHVDAMQDVAAVVRVNGEDGAALSDLARSLGGAIAAGRLQAQATGDARLADLLDAARVVDEDGRFSLELALPADSLERWFEGCAGASAPAPPP